VPRIGLGRWGTGVLETRVNEEENMIDKELLDILACPACKADVQLKEDKIVCTKCGRKYPVRDGIPVMLIDEAEQ
jgi:uncharacterized protein YbaR (Trm112 family)